MVRNATIVRLLRREVDVEGARAIVAEDPDTDPRVQAFVPADDRPGRDSSWSGDARRRAASADLEVDITLGDRRFADDRDAGPQRHVLFARSARAWPADGSPSTRSSATTIATERGGDDGVTTSEPHRSSLARRRCRYTRTRGQARSARRARGPAGRESDRHQGRLAAARPGQPPGPDRRRSGGVAGGDPADGRDQRRLCRAHARRRRRTPPRDEPNAPTSAPTAQRRGGPPRPKPTRPVTAPGRHDRQRPATQPDDRARRTGAHDPSAATPPDSRRRGEWEREALPRASTPTGPLERDRVRHFRRPTPPSLETAREPRHRVRQVPRPHARRDRGVRAVLHRLGGRAR